MKLNYLVSLARAYTGGGYTDWFLPSKDELNKMYTKRVTINTTAASNSGSNFSTNTYWSSTESYISHAWVQYFSNGNQLPPLRATRAMCVLFGLFSYLIIYQFNYLKLYRVSGRFF